MRTACWAAATVVAAIIGAFLGLMSGPAAPGSPAVTTASQVAALQHATEFTDCGSSVLVADAGIAYLGAERIGIDVFPDTSALDGWEQLSEPLGVVPMQQGSTWVVYRALIQSGNGCS